MVSYIKNRVDLGGRLFEYRIAEGVPKVVRLERDHDPDGDAADAGDQRRRCHGRTFAAPGRAASRRRSSFCSSARSTRRPAGVMLK